MIQEREVSTTNAQQDCDLRMPEVLSRLVFGYSEVPFTKRKLDEAGIDLDCIRTYDDFLKIPLTTKSEIQAAADVRSDLLPRSIDRASLIPEFTSGSTGTPLEICKTKSERIRAGLRLWQCRAEHFSQAVSTRAVCLGPSPVPGVRREGRQIFISTNGITPQYLEKGLAMMSMSRNVWIYGMAWSIRELCSFLDDHPAAHPRNISLVECQSESSSRQDRLDMGKRFGCRVVNYYGCAEIWLIAYSCPQDYLHINEDDVLVEVLNDRRQPCADGEVGEVVVTSLAIRSLPFIRYRLGDRAYRVGGRCPCGKRSSRLELIGTRASQVIRLPGGVKYEAMILYQMLQGIAPGPLSHFIRKFHFVQEEDFGLQLLLEPGPRFSECEEIIRRNMSHWIKTTFGESIRARIQLTKFPSSNKKHSYFESKIQDGPGSLRQ